ncbi:MAG: hypothetical protein ACD_79C00190G0002 [uncultured bacterium]|nr:MAG: hypothetical protein ACD_79C00190G0002 [uncultured bacterium]
MRKNYYIFLFLSIIVTYYISSNFIFKIYSGKDTSIKIISNQSRLLYKLQLDINTLSSKPTYQIIGNGQLDLPEDLKDTNAPAIYIVHGTNLEVISDFLKNKIINNMPYKIIITALSLKRCLLEDNPNFFENYLKNFKKSGDILKDEGKPFYYLDELNFEVMANMSGIVLAFPDGRYFSKVKNYGLAHLLQSDFSLKGLENPINFLEIIHFPKPKGFTGSFIDLVENAKNEFHSKYLSKIILIDNSKGKIVSKNILPLIEPKKNDKLIPLFKAVQLSDNVYFSGLILSEKAHVNADIPNS